MYTIRNLGFYVSVALMLSGCAARRYQPPPIVPTQTAVTLATRRLNDPGLHAFVEKNVSQRLFAYRKLFSGEACAYAR